MPSLNEDTGVVLPDQQSIPAGIGMCSNMLLQNVDLKCAIHYFIYPPALIQFVNLLYATARIIKGLRTMVATGNRTNWK